MSVSIEGPLLGQSAVCEPILRSLPDWFGIEESTAQYVRDIETMPTLIARADQQTVGFLTIHQHNAYSAEIHVMGILLSYHRQGIGKALVCQAEDGLRKQGVEFFQVKTISSSCECEAYARTRQFYRAMGFRPLEEFPTLWGTHNPCLQMVKWIGEPQC
jgi:ribosomal protein S18 acetylase RimI-like enzyme